MAQIPITCVICGENKNPDLMMSGDTCHDCSDTNRKCKTCGSARLAKIWNEGSCPVCKARSKQYIPKITAIEQDAIDIYNSIIAVTDAQVANKTVMASLGMAQGSTVRAKHIGTDIGASLKGVVGGEIKGYTELLVSGRNEALRRMKQDAAEMGADAVTSVRISTSMIVVGAVEVMAYGTAVKLKDS
jgi:uncharacterized protein YbjQ (UPF0145 family)